LDLTFIFFDATKDCRGGSYDLDGLSCLSLISDSVAVLRDP